MTTKLETLAEPVVDKIKLFGHLDFGLLTGMQLTPEQNKVLNSVFRKLLEHHFSSTYLESITDVAKSAIRDRMKAWLKAMKYDKNLLSPDVFAVTKSGDCFAVRNFIKHFGHITDKEMEKEE